MRVDFLEERIVGITLSRRNLLALLSKLDHEESEKRIHIFDGKYDLYVSAEPDEIHYANREPGKMSPVTEADIERLKKQGFAPPPEPPERDSMVTAG